MTDEELLLDPEKKEELKKIALDELATREEYLRDWREVLSTPAGRRIIWDLLGGMGFQKKLLHSDPIIMAANCGQYELARKLMQDIEEAMPGVFSRMTREIRSVQVKK